MKLAHEYCGGSAVVTRWPRKSRVEECAGRFGVSPQVIEHWEEAYVRAVADAHRYPLESDPTGLTGVLRERYYAVVDASGRRLQEAGQDPARTGTGDRLLALESGGEPASAFEAALLASMAKKRGDGVRDADFRRWWNDHLLISAVRAKLHAATIDCAHARLTGKVGLTSQQAKLRIMRSLPVFGDPEDAAWAAGKDQPLCFELSPQVDEYVRRREKEDPVAWRSDLERFSSVNALVRHELSTGRLHG